MKDFLKFCAAWAIFIGVVVIFAVGYAGSMGDMWEHAFDSARRKCIYDGGTPVDVRKSTGEMFAVRCDK